MALVILSRPCSVLIMENQLSREMLCLDRSATFSGIVVGRSSFSIDSSTSIEYDRLRGDLSGEGFLAMAENGRPLRATRWPRC